MENPSPLARPHVEGANMAWSTRLRPLAGGGPQDEQIFPDHWWGVVADGKEKDVGIKTLSMADAPLRSEVAGDLTGFGIQGVEMISCRKKDPLITLTITPVSDTAAHAPSPSTLPWVKTPSKLSCDGIQCHTMKPRCGDEHRITYNDGVALNGASDISRMPNPGRFQLMHVGPMDLIEAGIMRAPIVSVIDFPAAMTCLGIQVFLSTEDQPWCQPHQPQEQMCFHGNWQTIPQGCDCQRSFPYLFGKTRSLKLSKKARS